MMLNLNNKYTMKNIRYAVLILVMIFSIPIMAQENIEDYTVAAKKIIAAAHADSNSWERLAELCDSFGPRFVGTENTDKAIEWCYQEMLKDGFENVKKEDVTVFRWIRGDEYCKLVEPWAGNIPCSVLGGSVSTPKEGITAEVVCISSKEELEEKKDEIKGKIVLFDEPYKGYGHNVQYRIHGADWASKYGAIASAMRPCTHKSYNNAHTGVMRYQDSTVKKIPHFSLTDEATNLISRICGRGQKVVLKLYSEAKDGGMGESHNLMCEYLGTSLKEEIVLASGHLDSWDADVSTGAHDDAAGFIVPWEAVKLIKNLGLKTKRTLRVVAWIDEEYRQTGGKQYAKDHAEEEHFGLLEFDSGCFDPKGVDYLGPDSIYQKLLKFEPVMQLVSDSIHIRNKGWGGVDIRYMGDLGYPMMGWRSYNKDYFIYHHSALDVPEAIDPKVMNDNIAAMAIFLYIYANL